MFKVGQKVVLTRRRAITHRWLQVVFVATVSGIAAPALLWWQRDALDNMAEIPRWVMFCLAAVLVLLSLRGGIGRLVAFAGIRHALAYPPLWIGAAFGVGAGVFVGTSQMLGLAITGTSEGQDDVVPAALLLVGAPLLALLGAVGFSVGRRWRRRRALRENGAKTERTSRDIESVTPSALNVVALREWLQRDTPVRRADSDLFGHAAIAKRIGERLTRDQQPSQAVVGELGAGKTSVRHLLEESLRTGANPEIEVVSVELWPYDNPRAAVQGVIATLVEALGQRVNVFSLRGLPAAYAEAITAVGGIPALLARIREPSSSPFKTLYVIDRIATAIDARYVLWVEDLERFAVGGAEQQGRESPQEAERLAPIRALLYGLDRLQSVTVVTATTSLYKRFDLEKIARYVERIPSLKPAYVKQVVRLFRADWQNKELIDPTGQATRRAFGWDLDADADALYRAMLGDKVASLADAVAALCPTPRVLKQSLRRSDEVWSKLAGEIDVDAALAMSFVREGVPTAFTIVEQYVAWTRGRPGRGSGQAKEDGLDTLRERLTDTGMSADAVDAVALIAEKTIKESMLAQGFAHHSHADYWHRFMAIPALSEEERDQTTLKAIVEGNDQLLLDLLCDEKRSPTFEDFAGRIDAERLVGLLAPLVLRVAPQHAREWDEGYKPPGLIPLWRAMLARARAGSLSEELLGTAVVEALAVAVPVNLTLAEEIEHWLVAEARDVRPTLLPAAAREAIATHLRALLVDQYAGKPDVLAERLEGAVPYMLLWLCWGIERVRDEDFADLPFDRWSELAETILDSAAGSPTVMLPQLACLLVNVRTGLGPAREHVFESERCLFLFGDVGRVLALFENPPEVSGGQEYVAAVKTASDVAVRDRGLVSRARSGLAIERTHAMREAEGLANQGEQLGRAVIDAVVQNALNRDRPMNERIQAIAVLREANEGGRARSSLLAEVFAELPDKEFVDSVFTLFVNEPAATDEFCEVLGALPVPERDSHAEEVARRALSVIHGLITRHSASIGAERARRCVAVANRFESAEVLAGIVGDIRALVDGQRPD